MGVYDARTHKVCRMVVVEFYVIECFVRHVVAVEFGPEIVADEFTVGGHEVVAGRKLSDGASSLHPFFARSPSLRRRPESRRRRVGLDVRS